jgi:hypothetical protein
MLLLASPVQKRYYYPLMPDNPSRALATFEPVVLSRREKPPKIVYTSGCGFTTVQANKC